MKILVLMNKDSGEIGLGVQINFFNNHDVNEELVNLEGYSLGIIPAAHDAWLIFTGADGAEGPWMHVKSEHVDEKVQILGEL